MLAAVSPETVSELLACLADAGLRNLPLERIVDGLSRRLNRVGIPVARTFVAMNTLHPMVTARSLIWDRRSGPSARYEFDHITINDPLVQQSPFVRMVRESIDEERWSPTDADALPRLPVFEELRAAGMTEWLGRVKTRHPGVEIVFIGGAPSNAEGRPLDRHERFVRKPFTAKQLIDAIRAAAGLEAAS